MAANLRNWWNGLNPRERWMVAVAGLAIVVAILYVVAVEPAWKTRARLTDTLPRLQTELIQLESLQAEAMRLGGAAAIAPSGQAMRSALEKSIARAKFSATVDTTSDGDSILVAAQSVSPYAWFAWMEAFVRESQATVITATVSRDDTTGRVAASVSFQVGVR